MILAFLHMHKPMPTYPAKLKVFCLALGIIYSHTLYMRAAKAQASLHICADSSEPLLLSDAFSTEISCTGTYICAM